MCDDIVCLQCGAVFYPEAPLEDFPCPDVVQRAAG